MKKTLAAACLTAGFLWYPVIPAGGGVKTSLKQYSIVTHQNQDILCEPYTVKKDDWLYKIFRQKGEISERDFPLFISIFKKINPRISNIDTISPGIRILIPLKIVNRQAYASDDAGRVAVPVVEFSHLPAPFDATPHVREHVVQPGDTISDLLDKAFLKKGGGVTREGRLLFYRLNPGIKNIHVVYPGTLVHIPEPAILSQPWLSSFLSPGRPPGQTGPAQAVVQPRHTPRDHTPENTVTDISASQLRQLKKYAALMKGTLVHQGKMHFPAKNGGTAVLLNLARTPLVESRDQGEKILLFPGKQTGYVLDKKLVQTIRSHWQHAKIEQIQTAVQKVRQHTENAVSPALLKKHFPDILAGTPGSYFSEEKIHFRVNNILLSAVFGRITRHDAPDLLVNFGDIYGTAVTSIQNMGFDILSLSPNQPWKEQVRRLLSALGYSIWENPSFSHRKRVETLEGLYAELLPDRVFISLYPLPSGAGEFLQTEQIRHIRLE